MRRVGEVEKEQKKDILTSVAEDRKLSLIGLTKIAKVGPVACRRLIKYFGGVEEVFRAPQRDLLRVEGIGEKLAKAVSTSKTMHAAEAEMRFTEKEGIQVLSYMDREYPSALRNSAYAPLILYKKGSASLNSRPAISIVGTRRPSDYGRELAATFADFFAKKGFNIVSGLAFGIDIQAHDAALSVAGMTTSVLGHGLDMVYPSQHVNKAGRIVESGGVLLSEFTSRTTPEAYNFPARNRIISGLSNATIVIEARERGGAQITARFAFEQNREVYAVPGPLNSSTSVGCNRLIRDQIAKLVMSPQEILDDLKPILEHKCANVEVVPGPAINENSLSTKEKRVVDFVRQSGPVIAEKIIENLDIESCLLSSLLLNLEIQGVLGKESGRVCIVR